MGPMNPIYLAIDTADAAVAGRLIDDVRESIGGVKIGLTFWFANGPTVVGDVVTGLDWFLDIKLHDIPTQVAGAIRAVLPLAPTYISLHEKGRSEERRVGKESRSRWAPYDE